MACNLNIASGPYTMEFNSQPVGEVAAAKILQYSAEARDVTADLWGDTVVDGIFRGMNVFLVCVLKEWDSVTVSILWPWGNSFGRSGPMGTCLSDNLAKQLVLRAVAGTPAASLGPTSLTAEKAIISPGHSPQIAFGTEERDVPIVFRLLPTINPGGAGNEYVEHFVLDPTDGVI